MALRLPCIVSSALLTAGGFPPQPSARSFPPSLGIALSGDLPLIFFSLLLLLLPLLRAHFLFPRRPFVGVDRSTQRLRVHFARFHRRRIVPLLAYCVAR